MLHVMIETHPLEANDMSRPVATSHDEEPCTVSVPEASELFAAAGLPRTERAIQRFCKKGELKWAFVETSFGSKYLIARSSIDRLIIQKQQAQKFARVANGRDLSRPGATSRDKSHDIADDTDISKEPTIFELKANSHESGRDKSSDDMSRQGATTASDARDQIVEKLREEIFDLKVDNAGKQNFIRQLVADRTQLMGEVKQISYELGAAQTKVAQLEAPKTYDVSRQVATSTSEPAAEVMRVEDKPSESAVSPPAASYAPPATAPKRSFLGRMFGK